MIIKTPGYRYLELRKTIYGAGLQWLMGCILCCCTAFSAEADIILEEFVEPKFNAIEKFDHLSTGFPLTGDHDLLDCKQCHTAGFFEKLPTRCDTCHDNTTAQGMPATHAKVTGPCDICHTTTGFIENLVMDHRFVEGTCFTCHNGHSLKGKSATHIGSSTACETCHSTTRWIPVESLDHSQLEAPCQVCHNGINATGKPSQHIASSDQCNACHSTSGAWLPATTDHDQVRGVCSNCHTVPPAHARSTKLCGNCHLGRSSWRDKLFMDHDEVRGSCTTCHSLPGSHGTALRHCTDCHSITSFKAVHLDHAKVRELACESCHNGIFVETKSQKHCPTTVRCEACHHTHGWNSQKRC